MAGERITGEQLLMFLGFKRSPEPNLFLQFCNELGDAEIELFRKVALERKIDDILMTTMRKKPRFSLQVACSRAFRS